MALVKCKECGEEISSKAKDCPKCGAKPPKKTSLFTWLVLIIIVSVIYSVSQSSTSTSVTAKETSSASPKISSSVSPKPSWSTTTSKDEMTGEFSAYAHSPRANPSEKMSFPYSKVYSWMGIGCDSKSEWVYFGFNTAPNLTKDKTEDGYSKIETRVRWDKEIEDVVLTQDWGAKYIHFSNDTSAMSKIAASNSALLELQWHGQKSVYFDFTLNGSSKALSDIRALCSKDK
ncbi:MAG: RNA polymerase subunit RPABC4/transcription elongation factor Spt4 [Cocleimonas sp.]|jgi:RNA polymerase subunit RPABC4/transcription elongation factor Spt4